MVRVSILCASLLASLASANAGAATIDVELNKLETSQKACRAYLVLRNHTGAAFSSLKLDLVMFDREGIVAKRLAVEAGPLPVSKTSLKVFDMSDMTCESVGRVLLNDVLNCIDDDGPRETCLELLRPTARTAEFIK